MLDLSADNLMREIKDAQAHRDKHLKTLTQLTRRYAGRFYRADIADPLGGNGVTVEHTPENYPFAYVAFVLPQLCYQAPSVHFEPTRSLADANTADGLSIALNYWVTETEFEQPLTRVVRDSLFGFGVLLTTVEPYGDHGGAGLGFALGDGQQRAMWPAVKRISPKNLIWDSLADSETESRLWGHEFERDLDDVQAQAQVDPTWVPEAVAKLVDVEMSADDDNRQAFPRGIGQRQAKRRVVKLFQLYVPEAKKLITLSEQGAQGGLIVREQDYFGPDEGPYTLFGIYEIPDQFVPLSVLVATFEQFLEVQTHAMKAADDAAAHKKLAVGRTDAGQDAETIKNAKNGDMVKLQSPESVKDFTVGGADPNQIEYLNIARDRYDRVLGFSDAQRGVANSKTATANQLAQQNSDLRIDYMRKQVTACTRRVLRKVAWYFFHLDAIRMQMVGRDPNTGQRVEGTFVGGQWPGGYVDTPNGPVFQQADDPDMEFVDFSLCVDVESMYKQDDPVRQKRAQDMLTIGMQMAGAGYPVNIRYLIDEYGRAFNKVELSKRFFLDQGQVVPLDPMGQVPQRPGVMTAQGPAPDSSRPFGGGGGPAGLLPAGGATPSGFGASSPVRMQQGLTQDAMAV